MLLASNLENIGVADAGITALLGYAVVFAGLIVLMTVIIMLGKAFSTKEKTAEAPAAAPAPVAAAPVAAAPAAPVAAPVAQDVAPGSAGQLKLHDVPPKTAAMLMAIVAEETGKPLNELRFTSIKEVK